jgi:benzylsuccinate CoA-transferase BbsE subunit
MQALSEVRVLDLTREIGAYTSKLFADLGAEVIRVEPLEGCSSRGKGPFYQDQEQSESSFNYWYNNTNKKGISVDLSLPQGVELVKDLVKQSDILIENFPPGTMEDRGLGYDELSKIKPSLVMTSITPFGQSGSYKDYKATDLIGLAMGGLMYLGGEPDRSPVRAYGDQSYFAASLYAAVGTMIAFYHAEATGEGQFVDVSMQESVAMGLENAAQFYDLQGVIRKRVGGGQQEAGWGMYPCQDGYIYFMIGGLGARYWDSLIDWMEEAGVENAGELREPHWKEVTWRRSAEGKQLFNKLFTPFTRKFTKLELYEEGQKRQIAVCPVNDPKDLFDNPQLKYREFFTPFQHPGGEIVYPGAPYRLSVTPWKLSKPAPQLGEHTDEVLAGVYTKEQINNLRDSGVIK